MPEYTVYSTSTGKTISEPDEIRKALVSALVSPVYWEDCMVAAAADGADLFYELGVNGILKGQLRRTNKDLASESFETWADIEGAK